MASGARHPVLAQVAEILVSADGGATGYGSGYRLGPQLVLTARHVVDDAPPGGTVRVRLGGTPALHDAEPVWRGARDLALLRLIHPPTGPAPHGAQPGRLHADPPRLVAVTVTGFPAFSAIVDDAGRQTRDSYQVAAEIATHSHVKTGRLELARHGRLLTTGALWRGASGGAVFAEGYLIGVVTEADTQNAALFAVALPGPDEDAAFWSLLQADGVPDRLRPVRRITSYNDRVRQLADRLGPLRDRDAELAELVAFATSTDSGASYRWIVGPPWAGKTALATYFAANPPEDVDVVAFFISRSFGEQTRQFQQDVCDQLAALADEPYRRFAGTADLDSLWERALERAAATGRHLVLLVDALDENDEPPPIAALLPARTGSHGHVLILSRQLPPVPSAVPRAHPLRDERRCPRTPLAPSGFADQLRDRATDELADLLPDRNVRAVLTVLAVGGSMGVDDIAEVLRLEGRTLDLYDVRTITRTVSARVLSVVTDESAESFGFAHDELRRTTVDELGPAAIARCRAALHVWADSYARRDWPDDTPDYLLHRYMVTLAAETDPARLAALPTPARIALWQRRIGHDGFAVQELTDVLSALAAGPAGLRAVGVLAMRRYRLIATTADPSYSVPPAIPVAWARLGQWPRAEYLASHIFHTTQALAGLAEAAADEGDLDRFLRLMGATQEAARRRPAFEWFDARDFAVLGRAAGGLGAVEHGQQLLKQAEQFLRPGRPRNEDDRKAEALTKVAQAYAAIGDREYARRLVANAERMLDGLSDQGMRALYLSRIAFASAQVRGVDDAVRSFPALDDVPYEARVHTAFARAAAEADGPDAAAPLLDRAGARLPNLVRLRRVVYGRKEMRLREALYALTEVAAAAAHIGDIPRARRYALYAAESVQLLGFESSRDTIRGRLARIHEMLGDQATAAALIEAVTDTDARLEALTSCARALRETGDPVRADQLFERAVTVARSMTQGQRQQVEPRMDLAIAVAEAGDPALAEQIIGAMSRPRLPFWETLALTDAVAAAGRLDLTGPLLELAGDDASLQERMLPVLAAGAARAGQLSLVEGLAQRCADTHERARILRKAAVGAAEAGWFDAAERLLVGAAALHQSTSPDHGWVNDKDEAAQIAVLAMQAGSPTVSTFRGLVREPQWFEDQAASAVVQALDGDLDGAVRRAVATGSPPDRVSGLITLATIASSQGTHDSAGQLLDLAAQIAAAWPEAADYAVSGQISAIAVVAARLGHPARADELLRLLETAHPDHRAPALAARAEAFARAGEQDRATATLRDSFRCLLSREGGAHEYEALRACVISGMAVDAKQCRDHLAHALATEPQTLKFLAPVVLAEPQLAPLVIALFGGEDPELDVPSDI